MTPLTVAVVGLSLSSSWGNGHATTYRSLLSGFRNLGHRALFLEREQDWYLQNCDLVDPPYCDFRLYRSVDELELWREVLTKVDAVIVGSYVPEGIDVIDRIAGFGPRLLCFYDIDTPITLASLTRGDENYVALRQIPDFDLYFSFSGGRALDRLRRELGVRRAEPLYCAVDPQAYAPTGEEKCWDLGYLGTYSADRQPAVDELLIRTARMLPHYRFVVAGPQYPPSIPWPDNVERIEHLAPELHQSFYSRQRYTLNVTRADMIATGWSPSVRLFEAAATATPVISDRWDGLDDFFPEPEAMSTASTAEEVAAILAREPNATKGQGEAARRIVLSEHTGLVRAGELAEMIRSASRPAQTHHTSKSLEARHALR